MPAASVPANPAGSPDCGRRWHTLLAYAVGVAGVAGMTLAQPGGTGRPVAMLYMLPIVVSSYLGGLAPGLVSTLLASWAANYFLLEPVGSFSLDKPDILRWVALVALGVAAAVLTGTLDRSRRRERAARQRQSALESQLAHLAAAAPIALCSFRRAPDGSLRFTYISPAIREIYGIQARRVAEDSSALFASIHPGDVERVRAGVKESGLTMAPWHEEFRVAHPERGEIWVEGRAQPELEPDGNILWHGFLADVTRRKHAEAELRRQASLFEQAYDGALVWEWDGSIVFWNRGAERLYGFSAAQALGRRSYVLLHTKPETREEFCRALEREGRWEGEFEHLTRDGRTITVESRMVLLREPERTYVLETNRDVTLRKKMEQELRASEERFAAAFRINPVGQLVTRLSDNRAVEINDAYAAITGRSREEVIGHRSEDFGLFTNPEDLKRIRSTVNATGRVETMEVDLRKKDGSIVHVAFSSERFMLRDEPHMLSAFTDITPRKQAEREIRRLNAELEQRVLDRTRELEAANQELEAFSYSVSHDLRAPLRAVDGFSDALLEDCGEQLSADGRHYLDSIRLGAQRMGVLIDDLLAFSRLGRQPLAKRPLDSAELVRFCIEELHPQVEGRQIDLQIGELPQCLGDPTLVLQVWINLLSNAFKYTRRRERSVVEIGSKREGNANVYFVRDNGTGFDMRYVDKLFGVFQRLHAAEEFEGTGVGLAIAQRIVHRHGGRIWAEGEPGRGATFYFTLEESGVP
jgi:PAS domain S-box-containing protein